MIDVWSAILNWHNYIYISCGVIVGLTVGAIPGMTGSMGVAILLPFTFYMPTVEAMSLLIGVYKGSMYGGAISAISFGTPGTPSAAADVFDGVPLAKAGKAKKALQIALYASVTADLGSDIVLILVTAPLSAIALAFGPREMLSLMIFSLVMVIAFVGESPLRGIIATLLGLFIGIIGMDPIAGVSRFTFGIWELASGIELLPFLIGLFCLSELIIQAIKALKEKAETYAIKKSQLKISGENLTFREYLQCYREIIIGCVVGTFIGALPGPGGTLAAFSSYAIAKKTSKNRHNFGKGALEGVAAPEAGDSGTCGATFIPMFAFGIPGSGIAALFMGAFMLQGITMGPGLLLEHRGVMYSIFAMIIIANFFHLIIGRILTPVYAYMAYLPKNILIPILGVLCALGVYSARGSTFDVIIMVAAGLFGYFMRVHKFPLAACLIGYILAPMIEANLRRSLLISKGYLVPLFSSTIVIILYSATLMAIITVVLLAVFKKKKSSDVIKEL